MSEKFDVIVVGAGPAGSAAAYVLASSGLSVLMIERGEYPGSKNLFGGAFCSRVLEDIIPNFWKEAPVERHISKHVFSVLSGKESLTVEFKSEEFNEAPYNSFTLLRSKFDAWFAGKAQAAGALLMTSTIVDDIIWKDGKAVGVKVRKEHGEVYADFIILADGINSVAIRGSELRQDYNRHEVAVGVKEIIKLSEDEINTRFGLQSKEGAAWLFLGDATKGLHGGGFLYTNKGSISLGVVATVGAVLDGKITPYQILEEFKKHPAIERLVQGGELKEYSGHLINEGGFNTMPPLFGDGFVLAGDAATMCINNGLTVRGVDFAIGSGIAAAEAGKLAKEKGDFSKTTLSRYKTILDERFVLQDMRTYRHAPSFMGNSRLYGSYPALICGVMKNMLSMDGTPKKKLWKMVNEERMGKISLFQLLMDMKGGVRAV